jgi:transcription antitermination factor NusG
MRCPITFDLVSHLQKSAQGRVRAIPFEVNNVESVCHTMLLPVFSRRQKRVVPIFRDYLFVRIDFERAYDVARGTPGVKCFVSFNQIPILLEDGVAEYLLSRADQNGVISARADLKNGQEVRICGGPFEGLLETIERCVDSKGREKILMQLLNRNVSVEVPLQFIETGWVMG